MTQVFISYAREDWEIAKKIYDELKQNGARPWIDKEDIFIGQNWKFAIRQAITQSQYFLALLSSNSVTKRGYVQKELKLALDVLDELPQNDIFILPILLEECEMIDERLRDLHWGELYSSYDVCMNQVLRVVQSETPLAKNIVETQRGKFGSVTSFRVDVPEPRYYLRKKPIIVAEKECQKTFKLNEEWKPLEYIENDYNDNGDGTISDLATGLIWQQSGSTYLMEYENTPNYIQQLNRDKLVGHDSWRLPTVDELMSLLEPVKKSNDLFIRQIFNSKQPWCWTSDIMPSGSAWSINFLNGVVSLHGFERSSCVRAVRS